MALDIDWKAVVWQLAIHYVGRFPDHLHVFVLSESTSFLSIYSFMTSEELKAGGDVLFGIRDILQIRVFCSPEPVANNPLLGP